MSAFEINVGRLRQGSLAGRQTALVCLALSVLALFTTPAAAQPSFRGVRAESAPAARTGIAASTITAAFTPGDALPLVLDTIRNARATLYVAAYSFTSKPVATALRDAQRRGVKVFVVIDAGEATKGYSAARFLANEGVPVRTNARYALQHNKFIVADDATVQTGSFNYTSSAAGRNAENVLVVNNSPALGAQYAREWRRLWDEGTEFPPAY
ncbi:Phospholipase D [Xylophilus ampelinus]|nr:Phospholipase D [Xylophilus ampelinus]